MHKPYTTLPSRIPYLNGFRGMDITMRFITNFQDLPRGKDLIRWGY